MFVFAVTFTLALPLHFHALLRLHVPPPLSMPFTRWELARSIHLLPKDIFGVQPGAETVLETLDNNMLNHGYGSTFCSRRAKKGFHGNCSIDNRAT